MNHHHDDMNMPHCLSKHRGQEEKEENETKMTKKTKKAKNKSRGRVLYSCFLEGIVSFDSDNQEIKQAASSESSSGFLLPPPPTMVCDLLLPMEKRPQGIVLETDETTLESLTVVQDDDDDDESRQRAVCSVGLIASTTRPTQLAHITPVRECDRSGKRCRNLSTDHHRRRQDETSATTATATGTKQWRASTKENNVKKYSTTYPHPQANARVQEDYAWETACCEMNAPTGRDLVAVVMEGEAGEGEQRALFLDGNSNTSTTFGYVRDGPKHKRPFNQTAGNHPAALSSSKDMTGHASSFSAPIGPSLRYYSTEEEPLKSLVGKKSVSAARYRLDFEHGWVAESSRSSSSESDVQKTAVSTTSCLTDSMPSLYGQGASHYFQQHSLMVQPCMTMFNGGGKKQRPITVSETGKPKLQGEKRQRDNGIEDDEEEEKKILLLSSGLKEGTVIDMLSKFPVATWGRQRLDGTRAGPSTVMDHSRTFYQSPETTKQDANDFRRTTIQGPGGSKNEHSILKDVNSHSVHDLDVDQINTMLAQETSIYGTVDYLSPKYQQKLVEKEATASSNLLQELVVGMSFSSSSSPSTGICLGSKSTLTSGITKTWREKICHWCYQVVDHFDVSRHVVSIALNYLDRYLAQCTVNQQLFQLAAMASLSLALKLQISAGNTTAPPTTISSYLPTTRSVMSSLISLSRKHFTMEQMEAMEISLLRALGWYLNPPTSCALTKHFLLSLLLPAPAPTTLSEEVRWTHVMELTQFLTELSVMDYFFVLHRPSHIAIAAIANAMQELTSVVSLESQCEFRDRLSTTFNINVEHHAIVECRARLQLLYAQGGYDFNAAATVAAAAVNAATTIPK